MTHVALLVAFNSVRCVGRCGVIQEGDRVVSINGTEVIGYSLDECKHMLDRSKGRCDLAITFDVVGKWESIYHLA